jgi:hypothetical protein
MADLKEKNVIKIIIIIIIIIIIQPTAPSVQKLSTIIRVQSLTKISKSQFRSI